MGILWIAFGIYILGIAIVLYIRPGIMFHKDGGAWKEFGLSNKHTYTIFPFWLFAVLWAFLSYTFATLGAIFFASLALRSVSPSVSNNGFATSSARGQENMLQTLYSNLSKKMDIKPISELANQQNVSAPTQMPGFYVLETNVQGPPKYVYYGQQPPTFA
jgi:hypothetical protein